MTDDSPVEVLGSATGGQDRGDDFGEFYHRELPRLVALARGLSTTAVAEDLAQEAMLIAYRKWESVRGMDRPDLWVRRVCSNLAVSQFRRRLAEFRALTRLSSRPELTSLSESSDEFWAAVRSLPKRQAQAAALRYLYDMSVSDIAETMSCSTGTVKQHLSRARVALARTLGIDSEGGR